MTVSERPGLGVLLDIDGVLYVGDEPIEGAREALARLRELAAGVRLVTNTTSRSRRAVLEHLRELGFEVAQEEVLTPAAMAVRHCVERGYDSVAVLVSEGLAEDLAPLKPVELGPSAQAIVLGDLGDGFTPELLNRAFRVLMEGAELVALQHNRFWRRADGLALDVGAYAAALEYASGCEATVVGKPARAFFAAALADMGLRRGVMVGDDVEADVCGAIAAGLAGVLVRTGKFRVEALTLLRDGPAASVVDSIADVPALLAADGPDPGA
ncbi:MAG TPA: TIGR01458 family HAD-type hydrolase [Solirubrobacteraceae bacterium]|nr:TIGR01458 family HAD-type hydrolase [Solirubrobacteraceae bacterium]